MLYLSSSTNLYTFLFIVCKHKEKNTHNKVLESYLSVRASLQPKCIVFLTLDGATAPLMEGKTSQSGELKHLSV